MKKKVYAAVMAGMVIMLSACGGKRTEVQETKIAETSSAIEEGSAADDTDILEKMDLANRPKTLAQKHGRVAFENKAYYSDGTIDEEYYYQDENLYMQQLPMEVFYNDGGECYGKANGEDNPFYLWLIGEEAWLNELESENLSGYRYTPEEIVDACEEKDGILTVCTSVKDSGRVASEAEGYGYDPSEFVCIKNVYELDAESYEILQMNMTLVNNEDEAILVCEEGRVDAPEAVVPDEAIKAAVFEGTQKERTLIVDYGTSDEKTYSKKISKACRCYVVTDDQTDATIYADPECTTPYSAGDDDAEEITVYMKSIK